MKMTSENVRHVSNRYCHEGICWPPATSLTLCSFVKLQSQQSPSLLMAVLEVQRSILHNLQNQMDEFRRLVVTIHDYDRRCWYQSSNINNLSCYMIPLLSSTVTPSLLTSNRLTLPFSLIIKQRRVFFRRKCERCSGVGWHSEDHCLPPRNIWRSCGVRGRLPSAPASVASRW